MNDFVIGVYHVVFIFLGAGLLAQAFPATDVIVTRVEPVELEQAFRETILVTQVAKVRAQAEKDLRRGVRVSLEVEGDLAPQMPATITVTNTREKLDTTVDLGAVSVTSSDGSPVEVQGLPDSGELTLAPGASQSFPVTLTTTGLASGARVGTAEEERSFRAGVEGSLGTPSQGLLERWQVGAPRDWSRPLDLESSTVATRTYGISYLTILMSLLAFAVALVLAALAWRKWVQLPSLRGYITADPEGEQVVLPLSGKTVELPNAQVQVNGEIGRVELFTKRGDVKFFGRRGNGAQVYLRCLEGEPLLNDAVLTARSGDKRLRSADRLDLGRSPLYYRKGV